MSSEVQKAERGEKEIDRAGNKAGTTERLFSQLCERAGILTFFFFFAAKLLVSPFQSVSTFTPAHSFQGEFLAALTYSFTRATLRRQTVVGVLQAPPLENGRLFIRRHFIKVTLEVL